MPRSLQKWPFPNWT
ncbi:hypothetical protein F383_36300 [Gossypium arboreum]|uniref:Uncharacterized protein n=1 Tax=Gossypium arboreum TaxID=29729 RepID=A0A0B0PU47_GOSAR|nr:hypothetical protein F383_36300 [Gossypium arboreum]